jgi:transposase-like protein/DDE family transposase
MELRKDAIDRIESDFGRSRLGDPRRTRRAQAVARRLASQPSATLPELLASDAEVEGAYRLMNSRRVTFSALMQGHAEGTAERSKEAGAVLVVHDTTDVSFPHLDPREVGYLQTGKAGFRFHVSLVLDANRWRYPLGLIHAQTIHRLKRAKNPGKKLAGSETAALEDKESARWWHGMKAAASAIGVGTEVIHLADRESDSYELMHQCLAAQQRFVFRVRVAERRSRVAHSQAPWSSVQAVAHGCEGMLEREVALSRRLAKPAPGMRRSHPARDARTALLRFSAAVVELPRPKYLKDPAPKLLTVNLVHVVEPHPPEGTTPVQWLLYTTEPVETAEQVARVVDLYRARWTIEEFNAALKTGCAYEARQFESLHALLNLLALSAPVACELLALRSRARDKPTAPAADVLRPAQIEVLRTFSLRHKLPASPTVRDGLLAVAGLGGHLKNNGEPGWNVLMRGMRTLLNYEAAWVAARQSVATANAPRRDLADL